MDTASRPVRSNQPGVHRNLGALVTRHASASWQKPVQAVDKPALDAIDSALDLFTGPLILDSFCGTGMSTVRLSEEHPAALVIGVDKSEHRLARSQATPDNCLLVRAHCEAVWRHLVEQGAILEQHCIFYPNPWPKAAHLSRRVHGHPSFPLLPKLGGRLELRSNWQVYVEECGIALHLLGYPARIGWVQSGNEPMTRFEQKYRQSGHELWRLTASFLSPKRPSRTTQTNIGYARAVMKPASRSATLTGSTED